MENFISTQPDCMQEKINCMSKKLIKHLFLKNNLSIYFYQYWLEQRLASIHNEALAKLMADADVQRNVINIPSLHII